ncbi:MAG: hypothetical protein R8G34_11460 [Paracoccaceae bacterium]|nr:hypothetical protein [Paracoccaceae bacterium]
MSIYARAFALPIRRDPFANSGQGQAVAVLSWLVIVNRVLVSGVSGS